LCNIFGVILLVDVKWYKFPLEGSENVSSCHISSLGSRHDVE